MSKRQGSRINRPLAFALSVMLALGPGLTQPPVARADEFGEEPLAAQADNFGEEPLKTGGATQAEPKKDEAPAIDNDEGRAQTTLVTQGDGDTTPTGQDPEPNDGPTPEEIEALNKARLEAWRGLRDLLRTDGGNGIMLMEDLTYPAIVPDGVDLQLTVQKGTEVELDLNGHTIDRGLYNLSEDEVPGRRGYVILVEGKLTIDDSSNNQSGCITGGNNDADAYHNIDGNGGGIIVRNGGQLILNGGSISKNKAGSTAQHTGCGGGVLVDGNGSSFTINGGAVTDNYARGEGGGVSLSSGASLTLNDGGAISNNQARRVFGFDPGAGVSVGGGCTFTMNGGEIRGNDGSYGAAVDCAGTFVLANGEITANKIRESGSNQSCVNLHDDATFEMSGGSIHDNEGVDGAGFYAVHMYRTSFTMSGGSITDHTSESSYCGGVCVGGPMQGVTSTLTMTDGEISGNHSGNNNGGGIVLESDATLKISGSPKIYDNTRMVNGKQVPSNVFMELRHNGIHLIGKLGPLEHRIGVTMENPRNFTTDYTTYHAGENPWTYFVSDVQNEVGEWAVMWWQDEQGNNKEAMLGKAWMLTYDGNGGDGSMDSVVRVPQDPFKVASNGFTREHYTFTGWNTKPDGKGTEYKPDGDITLTANTTLYAQWLGDKYSVKFNSNEGSPVAPTEVRHGDKLAMPEKPTRPGYAFAGWYKDAGLERGYDFNEPVTGNLELWAKWTPVPSYVKFVSNGGTTVDGQQVEYGGQATRPQDPTRAGHAFVNWFADENLSTAYDFTTAVFGDLMLWAKWNPLQQQVTFDTRGGGYIASQQVTYGQTATQPADPVRSGHTFIGWFADSARTKAFDFNEPITSDVTVYAKWDPARDADGMPESAPLPDMVIFPDVAANAWYAGIVGRAAGLGFINGYNDGSFGPNDLLTRGQAAVILWNMAGKPAADAGAKTFPDVKDDAYYYNAVCWASSTGVASGYANGNFGPDDSVTREQLAVMLASYAKGSGTAADYASMKDASKVSGWAASSVGWCFRNQIMCGSGDGYINPQGKATRAEAAKMVVMLYDLQ